MLVRTESRNGHDPCQFQSLERSVHTVADLQTDLFKDYSTLLVKHHVSILGRTDQVINQDRDIMTLV